MRVVTITKLNPIAVIRENVTPRVRFVDSERWTSFWSARYEMPAKLPSMKKISRFETVSLEINHPSIAVKKGAVLRKMAKTNTGMNMTAKTTHVYATVPEVALMNRSEKFFRFCCSYSSESSFICGYIPENGFFALNLS